jgi:DsbC/DsbD-like thiol-disulfide interchange protein
MNMRSLLAATLPLLATIAFAQDVVPKAELKLDKVTAIAGSTVKGHITLTFSEGLHGYQNPPTVDYQIPVKVSAPKGTTLSKVSYPKGVDFLMAGETSPSKVYEGRLEIPVEIKVGKKPGKTTIKLTIDYQQCNMSSCFPPSKLEVRAPLTITKKP